MAAALTSLGSTVDTSGADWAVTPGPFGGDTTVDCGLAGTVMRFVPPVAGLSTGAVAFDGDPHMRLRPVGEVLEELRGLGVRIDGDALPFTVRGTGPVRGGTVVVDASASSQFISAAARRARYVEGVDVRHDGQSPCPPSPHRHDRRDAARARRRGRRRRRQPVAGGARAGPRDRPPSSSPTFQRRAVSRWPRSPAARSSCGLAAADDPGRGRTARHPHRHGLRRRLLSTRTCGSPAAAPARHRRRPPRRRRFTPPSSPSAPSPRRRPTCAGSGTSAATRPTGLAALATEPTASVPR